MKTKPILEMSKEEILGLRCEDVTGLFTGEELVHIATMLGSLWTYDYTALYDGRPGFHAILKSGQHSDGFFVSKILVASENILDILSHQMVMRLREVCSEKPDYVAGVPDGATSLGRRIAEILDVREAHMRKEGGTIVFDEIIPNDAKVLLVEDFCTRGTGFQEAVQAVLKQQRSARVLPYNLVIINRGGLEEIGVDGEYFQVIPIADFRIQDWDPTGECPLCAYGSKPIKPKATEENWRLITTAQSALNV